MELVGMDLVGPASRRSHRPTADNGRPTMIATVDTTPVEVRAGPIALAGDLGVPPAARGVVLFAHGSGSGRHSPRNRFVARSLHAGGFATLLLDLLTGEEEEEDAYT